MEELLKRKELLKMLIEKEDDEEKLKALNAQYDEVIQEIAVEKYKAEQEQKAKAEADKKEFEAAQKELKIPEMSKIEVGTPGEYKAKNGTVIRLKKELASVLSGDAVCGKSLFADTPGIRQRMKEHPERAEKVLKLFGDIFDDATHNPVRKAAMQEGADSEGGYGIARLVA